MRKVTARCRALPGGGHHPWIFANDVLDPPVASLTPGEAVEVIDGRGGVVGRGYCNPHSLICIRMYAGAGQDPDDPALFAARLRRACALRARVCPGRGSLRLVHGESDGLPGLVIDRFEEYLSVQVTTLGMEQRRSQWQAAIQDVLAPRGVVLRNDTALRELEGLARAVEVGWGEVPDRVAFEESGVHYLADLREGQKTGFFFDQAENRTWAAARSPGARVLDVYAHLGGWALSAMVAGASSATAIDSSADACAAIEANAARNRVHVDVTRGDALEVMGTLPAASFEMVCVDPPALAKNRKSAGAALHHYRAINETAARLVVPGGLLLSSSCSHHVLRERFEDAVIGGVGRAGRRGVLVRRAGAAPDHPVLPGVPETEYLKHVVVQVG